VLPTGNEIEVSALAGGIEYAGAKTILMPLWQTSGQPLRLFMEVFYKMASSEPDKPLAFQKTMAEVRNRFPHPYYWAPLILRGKTSR